MILYKNKLFFFYKSLCYITIILGAMLIDMSSWNNSLHAYGILTWEIWRQSKTKQINNIRMESEIRITFSLRTNEHQTYLFTLHD